MFGLTSNPNDRPLAPEVHVQVRAVFNAEREANRNQLGVRGGRPPTSEGRAVGDGGEAAKVRACGG